MAHFDEKENKGTEEQHEHPLGTTITGDTEKGSYSKSIIGLEHRAGLAKAERKLLLKQDLVLIPFAILLYLAAYLDRGNLGNARLQGLQATVLGGSDNNYSLALSCFYITYIVLSVPGTLLAKQVDPSKSIALGALTWSIAAVCQSAVTNPAGLYVCRLFVGIGEAMFGQSISLHFSYWYKKSEIAKRIAFFIGAGSVAGAFGGLISFGVSSIKNPSISQWRILFLIEGCPSVLLAICVFFFLPSRPQTSRFLNEDERLLAITRLNEESLNESSTGIDMSGLKRAFTDWKTYVVAITYSCMNLGLGSVSGFLPTIIKGLGYSNAKAQLMTVPPYVVSLVVMLIVATISDRCKSRGIPVMMVFIIGIVGWVLLLAISPVGATAGSLHARYFGTICIVTAGYTNIPLIMSWQSNNTGSQTQRAVSLGMLNCIGQCLSVLASYSFPTTEGPKYTKGIALNIAFQALGLILTIVMTTYYHIENRRRDKVEGGRPPPGTVLNVIEEHDLCTGFRYTA